MKIKKNKNNKFFIYLLLVFTLSLFYLLHLTPGLKGDLEQSLRILLKQPVLLKSKPIYENKFYDFVTKIFYATENKFLNNSKFDDLKIDIQFSELEKLRSDRKKALALRQLDNPQKINMSIIHKGKKYRATARLKGDLSEHWGNIKQWSLRVKLRGKKTIYSMNEFSISIFSERDFPYNFVISNVLKKYDVLAPRYKIVNVNFNGDDWGLMLIEEQFHDSFYAHNKIKEAPIFKMTNENDFLIQTIADSNTKNVSDIIKWQGKLETKIFNKNEILKKTNIPNYNTNDTLVSIFKSIQEIVVSRESEYLNKLNKYIDTKSFARAAAITAIFGDSHGNLPTNARYYLNPYNLKIQPILTDPVHSEINQSFFEPYNLFYKNIFHIDEFQIEYFRVINDIKNNFEQIEQDFSSVCKNFGKNCQKLVDLEIIKKNIEFLLNKKNDIFKKQNLYKKEENSKIFNTKNNQNLNKKKINYRAFNNGEVFIDNLTSENLIIKSAIVYDKNNCDEKCKKNKNILSINFLLAPSNYENLNSKVIKLNLINQSDKYLEITYLDEKKLTYTLTEKIENIFLNKKNLFSSLAVQKNKNLVLIDNNYILKTGDYEILKPIIIPSGFNLIIEPGCSIKMSKETYIMVEGGKIFFNGSQNYPIRIESLEDNFTWKGIYVNSEVISNDSSILNYVNVSDYSYFNNSKIQLTGGINLIKGNFKISNSNFDNSFAEDAINIVKSNFFIENVTVNNSNSDAIDIDFGNGEIINSNFNKILGDGIDLSGSNVFLKNININDVADKAISVGEESNLKIDKLKISSARIGIASKDSSRVEGSEIEISDCSLFDFAAYQKKSYFLGAYLSVNAFSKCKESLVQKGSNLIVNNKKYKEKNFDVKKLYDGTL